MFTTKSGILSQSSEITFESRNLRRKT